MVVPMQKGRLGRGLASLIGEAPSAAPRLPAEGEQRLLNIDQLRAGPFNPRKDFRDAELAELAELDPPEGPRAADRGPSGRRVAASRSSPASGAGARHSGPACTRCR